MSLQAIYQNCDKFCIQVPILSRALVVKPDNPEIKQKSPTFFLYQFSCEARCWLVWCFYAAGYKLLGYRLRSADPTLLRIPQYCSGTGLLSASYITSTSRSNIVHSFDQIFSMCLSKSVCLSIVDRRLDDFKFSLLISFFVSLSATINSQ